MKIVSLSFKNFMSYGNKFHELRFDEDQSQFMLISGASGNGKSCVKQALEFGLYGKVQNKNLSDLPNRLNKKQQLEVKIELICDDKYVSIHRGIGPNVFEVLVNDENVSDKAGKTNVQSYLETEVYKIPYHIFNNVISLSVNDFKSFIKMTPSDKRIIIDKIFGISIINKMNELLKQDTKVIKDDNIRLNSKIDTINSQIERMINQLKELTQDIKEIDESRKSEINEFLVKLNVLKTQLNEKIQEFQKNEDEFNSKISNIDKQKYKYKLVINNINEKLRLYSNSKCPTCGSDLHTEFHQSNVDAFNKEKMQAEESIKELESEISKLSESKLKFYEDKKKLNEKLQKLNVNKSVLTQELQELNSIERVDDKTKALKDVILENKKTLETLDLEKLEIEKELQFLKIMEEVLGESGIKTLAIKSIVPNLNITINNILEELNLGYKLYFNENFDAVVTHLNQEINVMSLSTGEQKRLDFAVLIAIIKLIKSKFPTLNLLFLDEIFASVDIQTVNGIIKILSEISKKLSLHTLVINHAPIETEYFTHNIIVEKEKGFSTLKKQIYN